MLSRVVHRSSSVFRTNLSFRLFSQSAFAVHSTHRVEKQGDVAVMKIDLPNTTENVLNKALFAEMNETLDRVRLKRFLFYSYKFQLQSDQSVKAIVVMSGKPNSFVAGADIQMFKAEKTAAGVSNLLREGQKQLLTIELSQKPIVAAIMGSCMGGGLEIALACHYRIAVNDKKTLLGLPEVTLGIMPGDGGTQRLPKLTTVQNVLDLTLTGKRIKANKAMKIGIVDRVIQPLGDGICTSTETTHKYLEEIAVQSARELANGKLKINRDKGFVHNATQAVMTSKFVLDNVILKMAKNKLIKLTNGNYPAPLKILDVVRTAYLDPKNGYEAEAKVRQFDFIVFPVLFSIFNCLSVDLK